MTDLRLGKVFFRMLLAVLLGLAWVWMLVLIVQPGSVLAAEPTSTPTITLTPKPTLTPQPTPIGPDRYTTMKVTYTLYEWWIVAWEDNEINCDVWVDHEGLPTEGDVYATCGSNFYNIWKTKSVACTEINPSDCKGFYFLAAGTKQAQKVVPVKLPPPEVFVSLENCEPGPDDWCTQQPSLILTGNEPLPNESIVGIQGFVGKDPFTCAGNRCEFKLNATTAKGLRVKFWAYSSYGDTSKNFEALLRVIIEEGGERLTPRWHVDVLSTQWTGKPSASCAQVWETFPPTEGLPRWLTTPENSAALRSSIPYAYLAGNLITQGVVDVSACEDKGLLPNGAASQCGLEAAQPTVEEWQNRFDELIFQTSLKTEVPAQLLKNLFSRESQFWPGVFQNGADVGLGQLTEGGADTALLWNPSFYSQFCPLVLDKTLCESKGYANLTARHQAILRGALIHSVDGRCDDCPLGLDLSRADFSVEVFARTLLANCEQAGNTVWAAMKNPPGTAVSYEDMWRFTLVNYNAGSGCLSTAVKKAYKGAGQPLDWAGVSGALDKACRGAIDYVNDIAKDPEATPTETPTETPGPTPSP